MAFPRCEYKAWTTGRVLLIFNFDYGTETDATPTAYAPTALDPGSVPATLHDTTAGAGWDAGALVDYESGRIVQHGPRYFNVDPVEFDTQAKIRAHLIARYTSSRGGVLAKHQKSNFLNLIVPDSSGVHDGSSWSTF